MGLNLRATDSIERERVGVFLAHILDFLASVSIRPLTIAAVEKQTIEAALADAQGRVSGPSGAAAKLGIPPSTLDSKIKALKINKHRFKSA